MNRNQDFEEIKKKSGKAPKRRYVWGSLGAAAACVVAVVVLGNTVLSPVGSSLAGGEAAEYGEMAAGAAQDGTGETAAGGAGGANAEAGGVPDADTGMLAFSDYTELEGRVSQMVPEEEEVYDYGTGFGWFSGNGSSDMIMEDAKTEMAAGDSASSDTYVQVKGVDEADIVKTDDQYIYYLDEYNENIWIVEAKDGKTRRVGQIEVLADAPMIDDFYLSGDTLVTIGSEWDDKTDRAAAVVVIYDIYDRTSPVKVNEYRQSGYVISSRMVGDQLYLVTDYSFYYYGDDHYIPYVTGKNGYDRMDIADICAFPDHLQPEYIIAGAVDVSSGKQLKTKAKAILGGSQDIYCNTENLYIAGYQYDYGYYDYAETGDVIFEDAEIAEDDTYLLDDGTEISNGDVEEEYDSGTLQEGTRLLKVSLNDGDLRFTAGGMVEGYIDNQFSMDERDGYLRIATTSSNSHGYDINNLFVLDENLKQVGAVTGFAKNEHVEAVRYIGEKAYVITYEQTDPLFVIDVSDPADPRIEGSVKIDGFSTLLVPAEENTLFGIGYATATTKFGEVQEGLKLVAFDISDPSEPKVADAMEFLNAGSEVQYNHKALINNAADDYYAIPYNQYDEEDYYFDHGGVLVVRINHGKIQVLKDYQDKEMQIRRCVYIGDYIYVVGYDDEISSFRMG